MKAADIHVQICEVYSENAINDSKIRKWMRLFIGNAYHELRSSRSSIINDDLLQAVDYRIRDWIGLIDWQVI